MGVLGSLLARPGEVEREFKLITTTGLLFVLTFFLVLIVYASFVTGVTYGRKAASQFIADAADASFKARYDAETSALKERAEFETAELAKRNANMTENQKAQLNTVAEYYERLKKAGIDTTSAYFVASPHGGGKPS